MINRPTTAALTRSTKTREVLHASCAVHRSPTGLADVVVSKCDGTIEPVIMLWAICPADGRTHLLRPVGDDPSGMLQAQCGHLLSEGVARHQRLPGLLMCVTCLWCYLVPASAFPRMVPAGHRLSDAPKSAPGGQPVAAPAPQSPRWCPLDGASGSVCPRAGYRGSPEGVRLGDNNRVVRAGRTGFGKFGNEHCC